MVVVMARANQPSGASQAEMSAQLTRRGQSAQDVAEIAARGGRGT